MKTVIAYDIATDAVRLAVAEELGRFGSRVQESVFECSLDRDELNTLVERLRKLIAEEQAATVRIYRLGANCWAEAIGFGPSTVAEDGAGVIP